MKFLDSIYPGYHFGQWGFGGILVATLYAAVDGFVVGVVFAWLYNLLGKFVKEEKKYTVNMVAAHWPESGSVRVGIDDSPLVVSNLGGAMLGERGKETVVLKSEFARRLLSTGFQAVSLTPGEHTLTLECIEAGRFGLDYLWIK